MQSALAFTTLSLAASVSASVIVPHVLPRSGNGYSFTLTAHGPHSANGAVGQLGDGQNRIGGNLPIGQYILKDGGVWDKNNRGCILTPPTTQWRCDAGASPTSGFDVGCGGKLTYKGSEVFYACPVNDNGEWNIYSQPAPGQARCVSITLTANGGPAPGCKPSVSAPSPAAPSPAAPSHPVPAPPSSAPAPPSVVPASQACGKGDKGDCVSKPGPSPTPTPSKNECGSKPECPPPVAGSPDACPADLAGHFEYPHLIVPVDSTQPDKAYGNVLNGTISSTACTLYNFDIHAYDAGKTCSLVWLFPVQSQLETSSYHFSGSGDLIFMKLNGVATEQTTWNNKPAGSPIGSPAVAKPGQNALVTSHQCAAGQKVAFQVCGTGDLKMDYFQDYNPSPIGLYVRTC